MRHCGPRPHLPSKLSKAQIAEPMQDLDACPCVRPRVTPAASEKSSVLINMAGAMWLSVAILKRRAPTRGTAAAA